MATSPPSPVMLIVPGSSVLAHSDAPSSPSRYSCITASDEKHGSLLVIGRDTLVGGGSGANDNDDDEADETRSNNNKRLSTSTTMSRFTLEGTLGNLPHPDFESLDDHFEALMTALRNSQREKTPELSRASSKHSSSHSGPNGVHLDLRVTVVPPTPLQQDTRPLVPVVAPPAPAVISTSHKRLSSVSRSSSSDAPTSKEESFVVPAFPRPPAPGLRPLFLSGGAPPTAPTAAAPAPVPSSHSTHLQLSPAHPAAWSATELYLNSTRVVDVKTKEIDLEAQEKTGIKVYDKPQRTSHAKLIFTLKLTAFILFLALLGPAIYAIVRYA